MSGSRGSFARCGGFISSSLRIDVGAGNKDSDAFIETRWQVDKSCAHSRLASSDETSSVLHSPLKFLTDILYFPSFVHIT